MKLLMVWPAAEFSIWDVAVGYKAALGKLLGDENIKDYFLHKRCAYHLKAVPPEVQNSAVVAKLASESVIQEALYFGADAVLIVSGLNFHPIGTWLLNKIGIPVSAILTESPYDDQAQVDWSTNGVEVKVFTNELTSAKQHGWNYLPAAYNPEVHKPTEPGPKDLSDVVLVGTGWEERQKFLEEVDWSGINLKLYGIWPGVKEGSPLYQFLKPAVVNNGFIPKLYGGAKICLNFHRKAEGAYSVNPRTYEIAACEGFQLSDARPECREIFGDSIGMFETPMELGDKIRYYLDHDLERKQMASMAAHRVTEHTFDNRAISLLSKLGEEG